MEDKLFFTSQTGIESLTVIWPTTKVSLPRNYLLNNLLLCKHLSFCTDNILTIVLCGTNVGQRIVHQQNQDGDTAVQYTERENRGRVKQRDQHKSFLVCSQ